MNSHSFLYFVVRVGNGVFAIATLATFCRLLSQSEYGVYALGMAIATVASGVLFQWLNVIVSRFYSGQKNDHKKVMNIAAHGFWLGTATAALFFIGVLTIRDLFGVDPAMVGVLFFITVLLGRHSFALHVANAESDHFRYGLLSWAKACVALLAGFVLIVHGSGGEGALLGFLAGLVCAVIAFAPKPLLLVKLGSVDKHLAENMFRYGLPLTFNHIAIAVVDVADRFMIAGLLGIDHVAPYAVAYDLMQQSVGPIMNVLFLTAFPVIVRAFEVGEDEHVRIRLHVLGCGLIGLGLPAAVGVGFFASDISEIIFANDYRQDAAKIMPWLAAAIFVGAFKSYFLDVVFQLHQATKYLGYIAILMAAVNILLNLLLLPRYGVIAAAWATLAAFTTGALASWAIGKSLFTLPALGNVFWGSAIASATMIIVLYLLPSSSGLIWLLAKFAVGIVIYAVMAWGLDVAGCRRRFQV